MKPLIRITMPFVLGASIALTAGPGLKKAAANGDLFAIHAALGAGESINDIDSNGWTPLMSEVHTRHIEVASSGAGSRGIFEQTSWHVKGMYFAY